MKKILLASACVIALASTGATAQQGQPAPGASGQGEVGPNARMKSGTTTGASTMKDNAGDSKNSVPSGAGPNTNNMESQAGGGAGGGAGGAGGGAGGR